MFRLLFFFFFAFSPLPLKSRIIPVTFISCLESLNIKDIIGVMIHSEANRLSKKITFRMNYNLKLHSEDTI